MRFVKSFAPWAWTCLICLASLVLLVDDVANHGWLNGEFALPSLLLIVLFTVLGTLITVRDNKNRIGWLLLVIGLGILIQGVTPRFTGSPPQSPSLLDYSMLVLDNWAGLNLIFYPLALIPLLFPTGTFLSRRQRWIGWLGAFMATASLIIAFSVDRIGPAFPSPDEAWTIVNPIGFIPSVALDYVLTIWAVGLVAVAVFGVWSLIMRYRHSSPLVKAQIRWMVFATSLMAVTFLVFVSVDTDSLIFGLLGSLAFATVPISITVAITRYRLFEINRIISRTATYAMVVVLLGALYLGLVTLVTTLLPSQNALAVAASTLAAAALFNPLRLRVQRVADRKFNRTAYEAAAVSEEFAARLRESLDPEELIDICVEAIVDVFRPESSGVWLNETVTTPASRRARGA